VAHSLLLTECY